MTKCRIQLWRLETPEDRLLLWQIAEKLQFYWYKKYQGGGIKLSVFIYTGWIDQI